MKCLIAFACLVAVASAGYAHIGFASEPRLVDPVAIAAGAPLPIGDTVEVAAAKAAHFRAHAAAKGVAYSAINPAVAYSGYAHHAVPIAHAYGYAAPLATQARLVDPVAIAAGATLPTGDTYEVAAAKAAHFQAHAAAKGIAYSGINPAVAYSGYAHAAPIAHAYGYGAPLALASEARQVDPVAIAAGAPLPTGDTVEVAAAKAAHFQAHHAAKSGHLHAKGHFLVKRSPGFLSSAIVAPFAYAAPIHSYGYATYAAPVSYGYYAHY